MDMSMYGPSNLSSIQDGPQADYNAMMPATSMNSTGSPGAMTPSSQSMTPAFSHGGRVPRGLIAVHMNPQELDILDHQQGHRKYAPDHNRMYPDLEGIYRNVHMKKMMVDHAREHYATGGSVHPDHHAHMHPISAHNGLHGDTEIAYIGPHMRHVFDEAIGHHEMRNPYDGHRQYFNLGGFLGGLGSKVFNTGHNLLGYAFNTGRNLLGGAFNTAKQIIPGAIHTLAPIAQQMLPGMANQFGNIVGKKFGASAGNMAGMLANGAGGAILNHFTPQGPQTEFQQNATNAINQAGQNYNDYTGGGNQVNNIGDLASSQGGIGGLAKTGANLASSYLRSNPQLAPGENAHPLLKMGYNLASKYNSIANQPQAQQPQPQMG